jgi:hypothetical protein
MIIIQCKSSNRPYIDTFVVHRVNSVDEIYGIVQAFKVPLSFEKRTIIPIETLRAENVDVNKYSEIVDVTDKYYLLCESDVGVLNREQCGKCKHLGELDCEFSICESGCANFKKKLFKSYDSGTIKKWALSVKSRGSEFYEGILDKKIKEESGRKSGYSYCNDENRRRKRRKSNESESGINHYNAIIELSKWVDIE